MTALCRKGNVMKELVEHIVKALVDHPDEVRVNEVEQERTLLLELSVHQEDMGKVIGKNGRVAKAIRSVISAGAAVQHKHVRLDIIE